MEMRVDEKFVGETWTAWLIYTPARVTSETLISVSYKSTVFDDCDACYP